MSKPMPLDDFRAVRIVLEPDDFAGSDGGPDACVGHHKGHICLNLFLDRRPFDAKRGRLL